jgi:hypothetical protein
MKLDYYQKNFKNNKGIKMELTVIEVRLDITKNLGNYESKKIGLTAILGEGENVSEALVELERLILGGVSEIKASAIAEKKVKIEKAVKGEIKIAEVKAPVIEEVAAVIVEEKVIEEKVVATKAVKEPKAAKVVKSKATAYERTLDVHKKLLAGFLDTNYPTWKDTSNLVKAGEASKALVGKDFLDAEGNILAEFKETFLGYLRK